jgi:hypothetical protein
MDSAAKLLVLATAFGTLLAAGGLVEPASAQGEQGEVCKADAITVSGPAKFRFLKGRALEGRGSAMNNAIASWEREVSAKFGDQWAVWKRAKDTSFECEPTKEGFIGSRTIGCTISGRPCSTASLGATKDAGPEISEKDDRVRRIPKGSWAYQQEMARQKHLAAQREAAESSAFEREEARQRHAAQARQRAELRALERAKARHRYYD